MTRDLEETLNELGPECRGVVDRLLAAREFSGGTAALPHRCRQSALLAASVLLALALAVPFVRFRGPQSGPRQAVVSSPREYLLAREATPAAIAEIIRTQRPDGGWTTAFLTRQNARVLASCSDESSRIAYRKAMRNLRLSQGN